MFHISSSCFKEAAEAARHLLLAAHRSATTARALEAAQQLATALGNSC
jgi:hypothetical protein